MIGCNKSCSITSGRAHGCPDEVWVLLARKKRKVGTKGRQQVNTMAAKQTIPKPSAFLLLLNLQLGQAQWRQFVSVLFGVRLKLSQHSFGSWLCSLVRAQWTPLGPVSLGLRSGSWKHWKTPSLTYGPGLTSSQQLGLLQPFFLSILFPCALSRMGGGFRVAGLLTHVSSRIPRCGLRERERERERESKGEKEGGMEGGRERNKEKSRKKEIGRKKNILHTDLLPITKSNPNGLWT